MQMTCRNSYSAQAEVEQNIFSAVLQRLQRDINLQMQVNEFAQRNVTSCKGCDEDGNITLSRKGGESCIIPCPVYSIDCKRGRALKERAFRFTVETLCGVIPPVLADDLLNAETTEPLKMAGAWNTQGTLLLYGPTGTGKSFIAAYVLCLIKNRAIGENLTEPAKWHRDVSAFRWVSAYKAAQEKSQMDSICRAQFVVIDDLGTEPDTTSANAAINEIIGERYNRKAATIITSNLAPTEIAVRYGARVDERIAQKGLAILCGGKSKRC